MALLDFVFVNEYEQEKHRQLQIARQAAYCDVPYIYRASYIEPEYEPKPLTFYESLKKEIKDWLK